MTQAKARDAARRAKPRTNGHNGHRPAITPRRLAAAIMRHRNEQVG